MVRFRISALLRPAAFGIGVALDVGNKVINPLDGKPCVSIRDKFSGTVFLLQTYRSQLFDVRVINKLAPILLDPTIREKVRILPKASLDDGVEVIESVALLVAHTFELSPYFPYHVRTALGRTSLTVVPYMVSHPRPVFPNIFRKALRHWLRYIPKPGRGGQVFRARGEPIVPRSLSFPGWRRDHPTSR